MNIFVLDSNPKQAAILQCDKHIVKMIVESAQMLSTAHRMLDGTLVKKPSKSGKRMVDYYVHPDAKLETLLYKAVHHHHPCTVWTLESKDNYIWHYEHFLALCDEYRFRYGKTHKTDADLRYTLRQTPDNIPDVGLTQFKLAMKANPECMHPEDPVRSYREFYQTKQERFKMAWTRRSIPEWFQVATA